MATLDDVSRLKDNADVDGLLEILNKPMLSVDRVIAATTEALGELEDERANDSLSRLLQHSDYDIRRASINAIGRIGTIKDVVNIVKLIEDEDDCDICYEAIETLGNIGGPKAIESLAKLIEHEDSEIANEAANAIGNIGNKTTLPLIENAMNRIHDDHDDSQSEAWYACLDAIGKICKANINDKDIDFSKFTEYYVNILSSPSSPELFELMKHKDEEYIGKELSISQCEKMGFEISKLEDGMLSLQKNLSGEDEYIKFNAAWFDVIVKDSKISKIEKYGEIDMSISDLLGFPEGLDGEFQDIMDELIGKEDE